MEYTNNWQQPNAVDATNYKAFNNNLVPPLKDNQKILMESKPSITDRVSLGTLISHQHPWS